MLEEITSERLGERYYRYTHSSGVTVLLYPMKGYSTVTAQFSVKFGSVDNCAIVNAANPGTFPTERRTTWNTSCLSPRKRRRSRGSLKQALPATRELPTTARATISAAPRTSKRTSKFFSTSCSTPISPPKTLKRNAA